MNEEKKELAQEIVDIWHNNEQKSALSVLSKILNHCNKILDGKYTIFL